MEKEELSQDFILFLP